MASIFNNLFSKTKDGEITINLNLSIKIESDGKVSVINENKLPDKTNYQLPDLPEENTIIQFGKNV